MEAIVPNSNWEAGKLGFFPPTGFAGNTGIVNLGHIDRVAGFLLMVLVRVHAVISRISFLH